MLHRDSTKKNVDNVSIYSNVYQEQVNPSQRLEHQKVLDDELDAVYGKDGIQSKVSGILTPHDTSKSSYTSEIRRMLDARTPKTPTKIDLNSVEQLYQEESVESYDVPYESVGNQSQIKLLTDNSSYSPPSSPEAKKKVSVIPKVTKEIVEEKLKTQTAGSILRNFAIAKKIRATMGNNK